MLRKQTSLRKSLLINVLLVMVIQLILAGFIFQLNDHPELWLSAILLIGNAMIILAVIIGLNPIQDILQALDVGVSSFNDKDFSITIDNQQYSEYRHLQ
jgi:hypothetical protein